jgi:hypothetical protein
VRLTREDKSLSQEMVLGDNGQFSFANLPAGSFQLPISSEGFATQSVSGILGPGEAHIVPPIILTLAATGDEVQ